MSTTDAGEARRAVRLAGVDDAVAFAFAKTRILIVAGTQLQWCACDLDAWRAAIEHYAGQGREVWRALGVAP